MNAHLHVLHLLGALGLILSLLGTPSIFFGRGVASRSAHWVIRASDLNATLGFLEDVLGMRALRHEENNAGCEITCNGAFANPWSKTMVGYAPEDEAFCLEVTTNHGISGYGAPAGLGPLAVALPAVRGENEDVLAAAAARGLAVDRAAREITGPDGYRYVLDGGVRRGGQGALLAVTIAVASLDRALAFYVGVLGFHVEAAARGGTVVLRLQRSDARLRLQERAGGSEATAAVAAAITHSLADPSIDGRNAISMPEAAVRRAFAAIDAAERAGRRDRGSVVHGLRELDEQLGMLVIAIVAGACAAAAAAAADDDDDDDDDAATTAAAVDISDHARVAAHHPAPSSAPMPADPDGHEICLVSAETFERAVAESGARWTRSAGAGRDWMNVQTGQHS